jgi:Uma2 family endonuclease
MSTVAASQGQRLVLYDVPWERYGRLLRAFDDRHVRLTYDQGTLEIMTLSHKHEGYSYLMGRFVDVLTEECGLPVKAGRSTTFRRRKKQKGLEPDNCYWIANERRVRGKDRINLAVDPPPDLALETDIMHSSLNRLAIYAALRVPEVWRFTAKKLTFLVLRANGAYESTTHSAIFPFLAPADVIRFLQMRSTDDENTVVAAFRAWVQKQVKRHE